MTLEVEGLERRYGKVVALDGVTLSVPQGSVLALLGPSGSGKSTLLRLVAGLETPDAGRILLGERDLAGVPPQRRGFGVVFQDYALFPHLTVAGNVEFGPREQGWTSARRHARVAELLELVGLPGLEDRSVLALSGGQQQRVALARALATEPAVLLLDEPLSNLDAGLRESLQDELAGLLGRLGITAVHVTHDQEEAFALGDNVGIMRDGRLEQLGPAADVLARPRTPWLARFLGYRNVFEDGAGDRAGPVLLDEGRVRLVPAASAALVATVTRVGLRGRELALELAVTGFDRSLHWSGHERELPGAVPVTGDSIGLDIPESAWVTLA